MTFLFRQPIILTTFSALMVILPTAPAQVVLDGTMGRTDVLNGPNYQIGAELGQLHGSNLFHSFRDFNLSSSESATFSGPNSVSNIFSRVTGGNRSEIYGTIRSTIPEANLYFLNPFGIVFGQNARLDVQGSFHASTADTLRFQDGGQFNARYTSDSVLTIAPIQAFGFLNSPAAISVEGRGEIQKSDWDENPTGLRVPEGQTLSLIGGRLEIKNGTFFNTVEVNENGEEVPKIEEKPILLAPAGQIDLVGVGSEGDAKLSNGFLDLSSFSQLADIYIEKSLVDASTDTEMGGKGINVRANNLTLNNGRLVSYTSGTGKGGDITIDATGLVELRLGSAEEEASDDDTTHASNELISVRTEGDGDGGHVTINARQLNIKEARHIGTLTEGNGQGGNIYIEVEGDMTISGDSGYSIIAAQSTNEGSAGNLVFKTGTLTLKNGAKLNSTSAGNGKGGNIDLYVKQLHLVDGAQIASGTVGPSQAGYIHVKAAESITISGKPLGTLPDGRLIPNGFFSSSQPGSPIHPKGNAGDIILEADQLIMKGPSPAVVSAVTAVGSGQGGNAKIIVRHLRMEDGSSISARSVDGSSGDAGNITLNVADSLRIQTGSSIRTTAEGAGGGNISINSQGYLFLTDGSEISSSVFTETGDGGDITLMPKFIVFDDSPSIQARAYEGHGGEISVTTKGVYNNTEGRYIELEDSFDATSEFGVDGVVTINSPEVENFEELLRLRDDFLRAEDQLLGERCAGLTSDDLSSFIINNRDAPAENPTNLKNHLILDW